MISFFRKIRQQLLLENRVTRYLAYAVGEIFLVVVGILIALQVNNWNEELKNKALEQKLLHALYEEFLSNLESLDQSIALNESIIASCVRLGEFTGPTLDSFDEKELSAILVGAFKYEPRFFPNQGTLQEIISSGRLSILSDPELRKSLSSWQPRLELVKNQENYVVEQRDLAHEYFLKQGNFRRHLDIIEDALIDVSPSKFPDNDFKFLEKQVFESRLYLFVVASTNLNKTFYLPLKNQIESILTQIKRDIN